MPYCRPRCRRPVSSLCQLIVGATVLTLAASALADTPDQPPPAAEPESWTGPETDFREVDGRIIGPWWQGGGPGVVYFTGPHAQKHRSFFRAAQTIAQKMGGPYLEIHKEHLQPADADRNGILVYPDGTARVRLFIMPGGNSFFTMCDVAGISELTPEKAKAERAKFVEARKIPQAAFKTGMNYMGACGGFFTAASGYQIKNALHAGWGLWPGKVKNIGPGKSTPFPDVVFDAAHADHPLFKATDDGVLKNMYYNGGPIGVPGDVPDTEYLGKYSGGNLPELADDWFLVAYRPADNLLSGRCVIATGHPEVYHADFLLAMGLYAVDHDYEVPRRPIKLGKPVDAVIGDEQVHYYCLTVEAERTLTVSLAGLDHDCDLYLRAALPPTFKNNDLQSARPGPAEERLTVPATRADTYWIGVHGKHTVLNGARYTLTATLDDTPTSTDDSAGAR